MLGPVMVPAAPEARKVTVPAISSVLP